MHDVITNLEKIEICHLLGYYKHSAMMNDSRMASDQRVSAKSITM